MSEHIRCAVDDRIATITIDRPRRRPTGREPQSTSSKRTRPWHPVVRLGLPVLLLSVGLTASPGWGAEPQRLGAVGIGVSDLDASTAFYADVLGLEVQRTYELGYLNEVVLGHPDGGGAVLVLMNWPGEQRRYDGNNVKVVFYVDDPKAVIERIRARGGRIDRDAAPIDVLPGKIVGLARDPDDYVIEVINR